MRCLCCGNELPEKFHALGWHKACIKQFFGTNELPEIFLDDDVIAQLAQQYIAEGYTVTGVQKKLSLHLDKTEAPRLTLVGYPAGYILKPQVSDYPHMPESEQLTMSMADVCGIKTVPHALICCGKDTAYITKRIDRSNQKKHPSGKLAMEDFCQLDLKPTDEKYLGSYERCAKIIKRYSSQAGFDLTELFMRLIFCFLTGNSDMHLKNFSLIETEHEQSSYRLSPAYDLLPVQLFLPNDPEDTALTLNGKKQHLRRKDFIIFASAIGISKKAAETMLERIMSFIPKWKKMCSDSLMPQILKEKLLFLIDERAKRLAI